jgi:hypothetical protein
MRFNCERPVTGTVLQPLNSAAKMAANASDRIWLVSFVFMGVVLRKEKQKISHWQLPV